MTISWGTLGTLFDKKVAIIFIRETRFTNHLLDKEDRFTISFLDSSYKKNMEILGSISGRDTNKYEASFLTPVYDNDSFVSYIKEAHTVLKLKKICKLKFDELSILDKSIIDKYNFKDSDFHNIYIGEITSVLEKEHEE